MKQRIIENSWRRIQWRGRWIWVTAAIVFYVLSAYSQATVLLPGKRSSAVDKTYAEAQPANSIRVQVRYKKEYGYKYTSGVFAGSGPSSCDAFSISASPDPYVRLEHPFGTHKIDKMSESNGFYVCEFLVTDLPLNLPISVGADLTDRRTLPFEAWTGGSQAQPPAGQQRSIIIVSGRPAHVTVTRDVTVTLTAEQPRAAQIFEMIYALPAGAVTPIGKFDEKVRDVVIRRNPTEPQYQELRCRGGAGLKFVVVDGRTTSSGDRTMYMTVDFSHAMQPAGLLGGNLQPGQCAYADRALRSDEPYEIFQEIVSFGQLKETLHGSAVDRSPTAAERFPDAKNVPQYLSDAKHFWSFFVHQTGPLPGGRFEASYGRYWKPGSEAVRPVDPKRTDGVKPSVLTPKKPE